MSNIAKQEEFEQLRIIFQCRHEAGVQMLRAWLFDQQKRINSQWLGLVGDDLTRLQGEGKTVAKLIKMIDVGPTQRAIEGVNHA